MLYDERTVRDNIRNRDGKRIFILGKDDRLTPSARDWLSRERIEILSGEQAKNHSYRLQNGAVFTQKPEHMTHLHGNVLVPKTHPRIAFRGAVDTLESILLVCQWELEHWRKELQEILDLARKLIRCEVMDEAVGSTTLCGLSEQEIRTHSHFPQNYYSQPHFMPQWSDGRAVLLLNRARSACRETELAAAQAFTDAENNLIRPDILQAINRMSSMLYILMIREKAKK